MAGIEDENIAFDTEPPLELPPGIDQIQSELCAADIMDLITRKAALKMYRKYLDSRIPPFLTEWYLSNYEGLAEVFLLLAKNQ